MAEMLDSSDSDSDNYPQFDLDFNVDNSSGDSHSDLGQDEVVISPLEGKTSRAPTFVEVDYQQEDFVQNMKNKNTARVTKSTVGVFRKWLSMAPRFECRELQDISPTELNSFIGIFILSIRKWDGSEYEPDTLTAYQRGIDRYLRDNKYNYSILFDREFQSSRDVLSSKRKKLKQTGKGSRPHKADPLTPDAERVLADKGIVGVHSPEALQNRMWLSNTMCFGLRGTDENRKLKWGDVQLKVDENNLEVLEFHERDTKTRSGAAPNCSNERVFHPKQFATPSDVKNCPVVTYKTFMSHRPQKMCEADSPFYLAINHKRTAGSMMWFKCQPLGENSLRTIMKSMAEKAELPGRLTNHSARKSTATRLLHAGVAPTTIMQLTGHKNVSSVNQYAVASTEMQQHMSKIISNPNGICSSNGNPRNVAEPSVQPSTSANVPRQPLADVSCFSNNTIQTIASNPRKTTGLFYGATLNNCTVNINFGQSSLPHSSNSNSNTE